jgi:hypothetical protein
LRRKHRSLTAEKQRAEKKKRRHRSTKTRVSEITMRPKASRGNARSAPFLGNITKQENFRKKQRLERRYIASGNEKVDWIEEI